MPSHLPRQVVVRKKTPEQERADELAEAVTSASPAELQRLLRILHMVPFYVMLLGKNHRVHFHNRAFEQYFGVPGDRPCYAILRELDAPCRFCPPLEDSASGSSCVMEWVSPATKHAFRVYAYPFRENGGEPLVLKVGFNITSNVRVQQALDLSEQSYRTITDNLSIGIAVLGLDLAVRAGNRRLADWFGPGFEQGRSICEILLCPGHEHKPQSGFCPDCAFRRAIDEGKPRERELPVVFQNGEERSVRLVACPVAPRQGVARALIMMLEDVTERQRVSRQLQRARKLEAMGTLAGGIAHEINQPLSALHLYAGGLQMLLEKQGEVSAEVTQERLSLIMNEAEKIRNIITHMRALVLREGPPTVEAVDLHGVLRGAVDLMHERFAERRVELRLEVPAELPKPAAGRVQLEQVFVNLLSNALDAVDARKGQGNLRLVRLRACLDGESGRVRLEVADSGSGLSEAGERIFDPFFTTKEPHRGMGLGLSIVNGMVRQWGGELRAVARHPELGGAVFIVLLPLAGEKPALASEHEEVLE